MAFLICPAVDLQDDLISYTAIIALWNNYILHTEIDVCVGLLVTIRSQSLLLHPIKMFSKGSFQIFEVNLMNTN